MRYFLSTALAILTITSGLHAAEPAVRIRLESGRFEVVGLTNAQVEALKKLDVNKAGIFEVYVAGDEPDEPRPAMLGTVRLEGNILRFEPRFPPVAGIRYRAVFRPARLSSADGGSDVRAELTLPKATPASRTSVTAVYPTRNVLPENQLKFYLHFSAPMSRGEAYRHVRLLDDAGKPVKLPFLEIDQELWDPTGKRLTLLFDPGRVKRGLKPRQEEGPILEEGKRYTFVIDAAWQDAEGNALKEAVRKEFRVAAPEERAVDVKDWTLRPPAAASRDALEVRFPKPLDHAMLQRVIRVVDAGGKRVPGTIRIADEETRWQFVPEHAWAAGTYDLITDTTLEDLAGNQIGRAFELDLFRKIDREVKAETVKRTFVVR